MPEHKSIGQLFEDVQRMLEDEIRAQKAHLAEQLDTAEGDYHLAKELLDNMARLLRLLVAPVTWMQEYDEMQVCGFCGAETPSDLDKFTDHKIACIINRATTMLTYYDALYAKEQAQKSTLEKLRELHEIVGDAYDGFDRSEVYDD